MTYHLTSEEHKYLAGQRREKDSFERLIKERGVRTDVLWSRSLFSQQFFVP